MSRRMISKAAAQVMPKMAALEEQLEDYLPYVSLQGDDVVLTRGGEYFQCIRVDGVNSMTAGDDSLASLKNRIATIIGQAGEGFSFYVHKITRPLKVDLQGIQEGSFAAEIDARWQGHLAGRTLRDKSLTITIVARPAPNQSVAIVEKLKTLFSKNREKDLFEGRGRRIQALRDICAVVRSSCEGMAPRTLTASSGELLGFLEAIGCGHEQTLFPTSEIGVLARTVATFRPTFKGNKIVLSGGTLTGSGRSVGRKYEKDKPQGGGERGPRPRRSPGLTFGSTRAAPHARLPSIFMARRYLSTAPVHQVARAGRASWRKGQ